MGLLDSLKGALGSVEGAAFPAMINALLAQTQYQNLAGLVAALEKGGLGPAGPVLAGQRREHADHRGPVEGGARQRPASGPCAARRACPSTRF